MDTFPIHLLLADDDLDDCLFFKDALDELPLQVNLIIVNDGVELMEHLASAAPKTPDVVFLDLNMRRKNGFECLLEIKSSEALQQTPVIIFSTSFDKDVVNMLYDQGATYYLRKPGEFSTLQKTIHTSLLLIMQNGQKQPEKANFVLNAL